MLERVVVAVIAVAALQAPVPSDADWQWLNEHRDEALEALMPFSGTVPTLAVYRSYRDLYQDVRETYFRIETDSGVTAARDRLVAKVVVPVNRSIQQQILDARLKNRRATFTSLLSTVSVRRVTLRADQCPAVRIQVDALSSTPVTFPDRNTLFIHPVVHRFAIGTTAVKLNVTIHDSHNALVRWAKATTESLLACAG